MTLLSSENLGHLGSLCVPAPFDEKWALSFGSDVRKKEGVP